MEREREFYSKLEEKGVSRRDFMKFCTFLTATMGLSSSYVVKVAEALVAPKQRPPVVWLHFAECTGCSEAALKSMYPWIDHLVLEILSLEYHETIMAAAGHQAEDALKRAVSRYRGQFICVVEGAVATNYNGGYGKASGKTYLETAKEVCPEAKAVIAIGTCAAYGGVAAAAPNPGGYKGVGEAVGVSTVNIAGCPPNPINFVGTIVNYLLLGTLPALDDKGRPLFAYGQTVHDQCARRAHYDRNEFVEKFGSEEAAMGYCLYTMGCRGPNTYNNCPTVKFNSGTNCSIDAGHPCIGCSEPGFWDKYTAFYSE